MIKPILLLVLSLLSFTADESERPKFYAFVNGIPAANSFEEEARMLEELGYDGVSQVFGLNEKLIERFNAYQENGLHVLSVYLNAEDKPVDPIHLKPLANQGFMIELTVQKLSPKIVKSIRQTAETMAELNIKVAIYPHTGFAVSTIPQAIELIEEVDHPNLGVMFNLCHFLKNEDVADLEESLERCGTHLFSVSTNGADNDGQQWTTLIQTLDRGSFSQQRLFRKLRELGFEGPVGLQGYNIKGDRKENLRRSFEAWEAITDELIN